MLPAARARLHAPDRCATMDCRSRAYGPGDVTLDYRTSSDAMRRREKDAQIAYALALATLLL